MTNEIQSDRIAEAVEEEDVTAAEAAAEGKGKQRSVKLRTETRQGEPRGACHRQSSHKWKTKYKRSKLKKKSSKTKRQAEGER